MSWDDAAAHRCDSRQTSCYWMPVWRPRAHVRWASDASPEMGCPGTAVCPREGCLRTNHSTSAKGARRICKDTGTRRHHIATLCERAVWRCCTDTAVAAQLGFMSFNEAN